MCRENISTVTVSNVTCRALCKIGISIFKSSKAQMLMTYESVVPPPQIIIIIQIKWRALYNWASTVGHHKSCYLEVFYSTEQLVDAGNLIKKNKIGTARETG